LDDNRIFKALADPSRRTLLDLLHASDGRTLSDLCAPLNMSRFGVMKHLNLLEEAGLITTRKVGREKLHYLNAVPIRQIYDRWVSKYAEPWAIGLTQLQHELERGQDKETHLQNVNRIAVRAKPEQIWQAITDPEQSPKFWFNCAIRSDWKPDAPFALWEGQEKIAEGVIVDLMPPRKLVMRFRFLSFRNTADDAPSRLSLEIVSHPDFHDVTLVTVIHDEFGQAAATAAVLENGVPIILSGLKTLLETGTSLIGRH
jgi:DNA-binding transcriptional ArsR family regulator/uncharacterized protein YndB with AHSA1/START domain